jgi:SPX domain protein involved in polyphosphate accumulation
MIRRFNRYELKYVIHASTYRALVDDLLNFMVPDPYGDADGFYRVTSLYYDSPDYQCYRSKVEGLKYRRKLRLRIYPGQNIDKVTHGFAEIKQRMNRTVQKRRLTLPLADANALCDGVFDPLALDDMDQATAGEILYMVRAANLRPACIVSYRRQAFMGGRYEAGMRLTFDMQLQGRVHALEVNAPARNHYFMPPDWFIMEVKVNERIPDWMVSVLAKHECETQRVSKYCAALKHGLRRLEYAWKSKENLYG